MARANFVKKARKDNPVCKKGESYYWWKFRYGGKHYSLTQPKTSQLTQSEFLSQIYDVDERIQSMGIETNFESEVSEIIDELNSLRDETEEKLYNMPEQLQDAPTGELLQNRVDEVQQMIDDLECIDTEVDILENIQDVCYNGE